MKNKSILLMSLLSVLLVGCADSSHPMVGNTFTLSGEAVVETYQEGYDQESYFALLGGVSEKISTFAKFDTYVKAFFGEGFIKISDTLYEGGYIAYNKADEGTIFAEMIPTDNKGIDSESFNFASDGKNNIPVVSALSGFDSDRYSFEIDATTFSKVDEKYEAKLVSTYEETGSTTIEVVASFIYTFVK